MICIMLRIQPNYFLGFRINDITVYNSVKEAQKLIVEKNPIFKSALTNLNKLHITLGVTYLSSTEHVTKLSKLLDEWSQDNLSLIFSTPIELNFCNIGNFRNRVLFADIEKCNNYERLCDLAERLNVLLKDEQFSVENKKYQPHLTLLKLSKDRRLFRYKNEFKEVNEYLMEKKINFGNSKIESLQLLSMTKNDDSGYYFCDHEILVPS